MTRPAARLRVPGLRLAAVKGVSRSGIVLAASVFTAFGLTAVAPASARAARAEHPQATAFYAVTVVGKPTALGIEIVHGFGSYFELSASGGMNLTTTTQDAEPAGVKTPFTWSAMPRLRFGRPWTGTVGLGLSGAYDIQHSSCGIADDECTVVVERVGYIYRGDFEGGVERWWRNGFALRMFGGYGVALNPGAFKCAPGLLTCPSGSPSGPYVGVGIGYAF